MWLVSVTRSQVWMVAKVAKTIQQFNRTGSTQNRPRHGRTKKLSARAQRHIQRLWLGNRRMSAASIAAQVDGVRGQPASAQTIHRTLHQIGLPGYCPRRRRFFCFYIIHHWFDLLSLWSFWFSFSLFMLIASFEVLIISEILANQIKCHYIVSIVSQTVSVGG